MLRTKLRPYQEEARDKALALLRGGGGFALYPDPRTGKCLITLAIVEEIKPVQLVVICPKAAIPVWRKELKKHLDGKGWGRACPVRIVNYEQVVNRRKDWYREGKEWSGTMIVCDESHYIKSRGAARSRVVRKLGGYAKYRLALTGTPIAQGIQDAWAQMDFINPEIFGPWDDTYEGLEVIKEGFENRYLVYGGYKKHEIVRYKNDEEFYRKFHANSFRVTLREAREEPLLIRYRKVPVELTGRTRHVYEDLKRDLIAVVNEKKVKVKNVLACVVKLQQVCGGALLAQPDLDGRLQPVIVGSEKLEKLHEVVRSLQARSKFVVVARFIHEIERIRAHLSRLAYDVKVVRGGEPFDGKFACDCIVLQVQSGIAVDMSKADATIFYSTDYSYLNFEQARFRILSYDKPAAQYYFLLAEDTIDEIIYEAVTRKKNLAKLVCDTYRSKR